MAPVNADIIEFGDSESGEATRVASGVGVSESGEATRVASGVGVSVGAVSSLLVSLPLLRAPTAAPTPAATPIAAVTPTATTANLFKNPLNIFLVLLTESRIPLITPPFFLSPPSVPAAVGAVTFVASDAVSSAAAASLKAFSC